MIRVVIENVMLFLLPTVLYVAYVWLTHGAGTSPARIIDEAPLIWLLLAGAALTVATLIAFSNMTGGKPGEVYVPPVLKDGRIVPGHMR
jgi:hypothetical protein